MLVGDVIMRCRETAAALPATLQNPSGELTAAVVASTGSTLSQLTFYCKITYKNQWGETSTDAEIGPLTVGANQGVQVSLNSGKAVPPGVTNINIYLGPGAGNENQVTTITPSQLPYIVTANGTGAIPPNRNTAYLPDTNGGGISVATIYGWLNQGLREMGNGAGGIYDITGVNCTDGINIYQLTNQWVRFCNAWYAGYPIDFGKGGDFFRANKVTARSGAVSLYKSADQQFVEFYPIPNQTGLVTTLSASAAVGDTTLSLTSSALTLAFGLLLVGGTEIVAYSTISGSTVTGCTRGLGGTVAQAFSNGATVAELNAVFKGFRFPVVQAIGDAAKIIPIPAEWESVLDLYMLYRVRLAEQETDEAQNIYKGFMAAVEKLARTNRRIIGPAQMGGPAIVETYGSGLGGRWLIQ